MAASQACGVEAGIEDNHTVVTTPEEFANESPKYGAFRAHPKDYNLNVAERSNE